MTDQTPTTIRVMTISEGIKALSDYHDHIPTMLDEQKQILTVDEYRSLWNKLREEKKRVKEKIRELYWQFYVTLKEERMKSKRDQHLIIN